MPLRRLVWAVVLLLAVLVTILAGLATPFGVAAQGPIAYEIVDLLAGPQSQAAEPLPFRAPEIEIAQVAFPSTGAVSIAGQCETEYGKATSTALATRLVCWRDDQEQPVIAVEIRYPTPRGTLDAEPVIRRGTLQVRIVSSATTDVNARIADWIDTGIPLLPGGRTEILIPDRSIFPVALLPIAEPTDPPAMESRP